MADSYKHPFLLTVTEAAAALSTDIDKGLTTAQVAELQKKYPPNELDVGGTVPWYKIFMKQLLNAMILVRFALSARIYSCLQVTG
jgi:Na+-exporting ATPase